jgi:hypothetical protein
MATLDKVILDGTTYNLSGETAQRSTYHESGDMYDLLSPLEVVSMAKADYRIQNATPPRAQAYAYHTIHYFDVSSVGYDKILVSCTFATWDGSFCYFNPADNTYTILWHKGANSADWIDLSSIPSGCYLCMSCIDANYTAGGYKYLASLWVSPEYTAKYEGLDESISSKAVELIPNASYGAVDNNRPYFAIDMSKYKDCLVRLATTAAVGCTVRLYRTNSLTDIGTQISNSYNIGDFLAWVFPEKYLVFGFVTSDYSIFDNFDIMLGWVNPEVARVNKLKHYWGPDLGAHNADTRENIVHACVYADLVDLDVCRTLDGYYVCIHGTEINGHTIAETNLEDLELTYNQQEITDALELLKRYGSYCYINYRETTIEQQAALAERIYNVLGRSCVYSTTLIDTNSPLYGHAKKFYIWRANQQSMAAFVQAGADTTKVYTSDASDGDYTEYDYIRTAGYTYLSEVPTDGSIACGFISSEPRTVLNA